MLTPTPRDRIFFALLRGQIPESFARAYNDDDLANATLNLTMSTVYPDGEIEEPWSVAMPLRTSDSGLEWLNQNLSIRNSSGAWTDFLTMDYYNEILVDFQIPGWWMRSGLYSLEAVASLDDDGTCLFALSLTQEMEGETHLLQVQSLE
jgi:hypothetical protein